MAKIALKIFYKLQENSSSMAIHYSLSSTMVGENFEIWGSQMSKTALQIFRQKKIYQDYEGKKGTKIQPHQKNPLK